MDGFVDKIQSLSASGSYAAAAETARKAVASGGVLSRSGAQQLDGALHAFALQQHSIGILSILLAKMKNVHSRADVDALLPLVDEFATGCNGEQVRACVDLYCDLFHRLTRRLLTKPEQPLRGVSLLCRAIERVRVSEGQLTSLHADLCCLCLKARTPRPVLPFLDADINDIAQEIPSPGSGATFDVKAFLCYYYYGGLIYSMLKRFDRALFFFEMVLTMPAVAVSQIAVETYKKYLLVSLIHLGKLRPLPKYKPTVLGRFIKPACGSYNDLLAAYGSQQLAQLESVVSKNSDIYAQDSNTGLVKQVVLSMKKRNILRLTKTFVTLSLADVAHRCHLGSANEAEKCILYMIDAGEISATIDQQNGMVQFHDDSQHFDATETAEEVQKQLEQCIKLEEQLAKLDTDLLLNPQFVSKMLKLNQPYGAPPFNEDEGIGTSLLGFGSEAMQMN